MGLGRRGKEKRDRISRPSPSDEVRETDSDRKQGFLYEGDTESEKRKGGR